VKKPIHVFMPAVFLLLILGLAACRPSPAVQLERAAAACEVTEPSWVKPPEDSAVSGEPDFGYYYVNTDESIWMAAWWAEQEDYGLRADPNGFKVGWFRPAGAELVVVGERLDAEAPPLEAEFPCCYPTRFQAGGLFFPTEGCWEIHAAAEGRELSFTVWVDPLEPPER
jgi:hypothetical protein